MTEQDDHIAIGKLSIILLICLCVGSCTQCCQINDVYQQLNTIERKLDEH